MRSYSWRTKLAVERLESRLNLSMVAGHWADEHGLPRDLAALSHRPEVVELVQGVVDDANSGHSGFEQIKRFAILPRDFSQEEGELTPTLKLRRKIVHEHFADEIENLYA